MKLTIDKLKTKIVETSKELDKLCAELQNRCKHKKAYEVNNFEAVCPCCGKTIDISILRKSNK